MKKFIYTLCSVFALIVFCQSVKAQVTPPSGWGDFQVGLVNDNTNLINVRMKKALSEGVKLSYRYAYVNNGVDPNTNALSWLFNQWGTDYSKNSSDMGLRPGYVIYMLQEEGGAPALKNNILNSTFMRNYFLSIRTVAEKSNGYKAMFVVEPDTWGYFLQNALEQGLQSDPRLIPANVNNLGAGYEYLSDLPNTLSGVALAIIRTIHKYAPDSYCGLLMSFWDVNANGATGPPVADGAKGMVYWNQSDVDYAANRNVTFANQLLGTTGDRGNFIGVEKNGWSAGNWLVKQNRNDYYWNDTQNAKWISWSKTLRTGVSLPLLGWQISIGHMGLPNTVNRYEDTFMPYFFSHVSQYIDAGFIGFLAGKGLADCTDFTNLNGNELEANGSAGDDGWFFEKLKTFDASRPYLGSVVGPSVSITSPANNTTFTAGSSITISATASAGTNCTATKVEFFQGAVKIGEDLTSPYSYTWASVASGSYTLTAKITNSCGNSAVSSAVMITVGNNPPAVSITSPANGATFTVPASITINAAASDTDGTISKVDFYNGTTLLGTDTSSPYSFAWSNVTANNYTLKAIATDNGGAATTSATVTITVASATQSPYGGTVRNLPGKIEAEHYDVGGEGIAYHDLSSGNTGNVFRTDNVDIEATTDTGTGYNVGWIQAGEWLKYSVNVTTAGTYTLSARVAATAAGKTFHIEMDGVNISGTLTVPNTTGWQTWQTVTATTTSLTTGQKIMRFFADQSDFNINYVDFVSSGNPAPTTSITSPANAATFTAPASVTINANAADTAPGTVSKVDFYNGTSLLGTDTSSPYSFTWTNVAAGTYSLTTKATDNQGAVGTSATISITVNTAANPAPTTSITSPANGASFTAPAIITINANASDDVSVSKVDFYNGSTLLGTDTSSPYSFSWTNVAAGTYSLTTKATDNQGAVGTSAIVSITVNTASNPAPTTSITAPANGASFTVPATINIAATATDNVSVSKVDFYNGTTLLGTDTSSPYAFSWTGVIAGTYSLTTKATDNQGAVGTSSAVSITVSGGTNGCTGKPQYVENGGYVAGSQVQNAGSWYECKPYPYSGWCNGGAWAYAPGTGSYWTDAWILKGSCSGRSAQPDQIEDSQIQFNNVKLYPNPGASGKEHELVLVFNKQAGHVTLQLINTKGTTVMHNNYRDVKTKLHVAMPALSAGLYLILIQGDHGTWMEKYMIHE